MILRSLAIALLLAGTAVAQGTGLSISRTEVDRSQPVEVTADNLTVEQASGTAVFTGNARVTQGALVLTADKIIVRYNTEKSAIEEVEALSDVMFTNGVEVAEAQRGIYRVGSGTLELMGNVVLVQGPNAISGDALKLDLDTNRGTMTGNVKTVILPKSGQ